MLNWLFGKKLTPSPITADAEKRVRLTDAQQDCLVCASTDKPIYGENPSLRNVQTPNGSRPHNQRTIDAMVKRGYLTSDGKGGYLLTPVGSKLQSSSRWC